MLISSAIRLSAFRTLLKGFTWKAFATLFNWKSITFPNWVRLNIRDWFLLGYLLIFFVVTLKIKDSVPCPKSWDLGSRSLGQKDTLSSACYRKRGLNKAPHTKSYNVMRWIDISSFPSAIICIWGTCSIIAQGFRLATADRNEPSISPLGRAGPRHWAFIQSKKLRLVCLPTI